MKLHINIRMALKIGISLILLLIAAFFAREFIANAFLRISLPDINPAGKNDRVLVIAPHCDDEVLGCAEFIKKTVKNGGSVKVVFITNGDGFKSALQFDYLNANPKPSDYIKFGYQRQQESLKALKRLGVEEGNVIFLGYPDGGIDHLFNKNWDISNPYTSSDTNTDKNPYSNSFTKGSLYCGENLQSDLEQIISGYKPSYIIYPHPNDRHPDHLASNAFIKYTITKLNYKPSKELLYLVHRGDWPTPMRRDTNMYLVPPAKLVSTGTSWYALSLDNTDTAEKTEVIHYFNTQIKLLGPLLTAFERKNELFGEYGNAELQSIGANDSSIVENPSNLVIVNPREDTLGVEIVKGANILEIHAEKSNGNNIHVFAVLDDDYDRYVQYNLNLICFKGGQIVRLNLIFENNKIFETSAGIQSPDNTVENKSNGKVLHFIIPEKLLGEFDHMYVNMNSSAGGKIINRTAWRIVDNSGK